ncbi:MAG: biotin--[acetyl-CoA-carboxylase] ligase [Alphaproteobacteria bacterium]|nr:MAG: biotin--[acetyl-CoA-carboxylase] ligase [Alphaproteobacteria bacterium]
MPGGGFLCYKAACRCSTTTMVLADDQTAGRGRHNRPWMTFGTPHSLMCTWVFRPQVGPHFPLIVALALHDALASILTHHATRTTQHALAIKWPNDTLLDGKKLAGILCQNVGTATGQGASIVGIGLNISAPASVPSGFMGTFLPPQTPQITPKSLAQSINTCLQPLVALYETQGWTQTLHNSYVQRCTTIGKHVHWVRAENEELTGLVRGLTPNGHLELVAEDGTTHVIHSGEIFDKR